MPPLLDDRIAGMKGAEVTYVAPEEVGRAAIRYFAVAIGSDNALYTDADFARAHGYSDVIAPPTFICETNQYATGHPDEDGYLGHSWGLTIPGTRLIRSGNEYQLHRPISPQDRVTVTWRVADITERKSSTGKALLFLISEATYTDVAGEVVATNRETLIFEER